MEFHQFVNGARNDLLFICDHASRYIPEEFADLGLAEPDLSRHIAWDIGAETVTRTLAAHFNAPALIAGVSRLVIDLNRDPDQDGLIPEVSDGTPVPGNQGLSAAETARRRTLYYDPYHNALSARLDAMGSPFVVSVHSFTPHPLTGERRELDLGLLAKRNADGGDWGSAETFLEALPSLTTAINKPYSAYDLNHTMDAHVVPRRLRHLGIEMRQDHIGSDDTARAFAALITPAIATVLSETTHASH